MLSEAEQALVRFARQVARDASRVTDEQVASLKAYGFGDGEIFDIVAAVAARSFFTRVLDALGVQMDSSFLALDEPLRRAFTVGRPIDTAPPCGCGTGCRTPLGPAFAGRPEPATTGSTNGGTR